MLRVMSNGQCCAHCQSCAHMIVLEHYCSMACTVQRNCMRVLIKTLPDLIPLVDIVCAQDHMTVQTRRHMQMPVHKRVCVIQSPDLNLILPAIQI